MRLKSYFSATVEEAISLASRELGEDAMLVYSRETMPEARNLGRYEVVFALEAETQSAAEPAAERGSAPAAPLVPASRPPESGAPWREIQAELAEMKRQFTRMERLMVHTAGAAAASRWNAEMEELFQDLLARELPADLAASVVSATEQAQTPDVQCGLAAAMSELAAQLGALSCGREALRPSRAHLFVGPPGGGKTTTLVKLSVLLGVEQRLPVTLVSLDSRRIGGAEQLKTFAQILGVPFRSVDHRAALERLIESEGRQQTLFIDTPGFSEEDLAELRWLPGLLAECSDASVHLVLPAYARTYECARMVRRYQAFRPASIMLTHVDESETVGGVIGEMLRCGLPVSYCGTGQSIPEDIRAGDPDWLARRALGMVEESAARTVRVSGGEATWAVA